MTTQLFTCLLSFSKHLQYKQICMGFSLNFQDVISQEAVKNVIEHRSTHHSL